MKRFIAGMFGNANSASQITSLQEQVASLTAEREITRNNRDQLTWQLPDARARLASLQSELWSRRSYGGAVDLKKNELDRVTQALEKEKEEYRDQFRKLEEAERIRDQKAGDLQNVRQQIEEIGRRLRELRARSDALNEIIRSLAPEPIYAYKCVNGIVNCKNHPLDHSGGTFLANEDEINQHAQHVESAKKQQERLEDEIRSLGYQYDNLVNRASDLERGVEIARINIQSLKNLLDFQENKVNSTKEYFDRVSQEYEELKVGVEQVDSRLSDAQALIDSLSQQLDSENRRLVDIERRLVDAEFSLSQITGNAQENAMLEEMVRRDLQAESSSNFSGGSFSGPPQNISTGDIERMVMQELASEAGAVRDFGSRVASDVREARQAVRNFAGDIATTIGDLYPSAGVGLLMKAMGQRMDEVAGIPSQEDASGSRNLILEYARQNPR